MASLIERDRAENGGAGVLPARDGERLHECWRGAVVYDLGGPQRRCGCTIGPVHVHSGGAWGRQPSPRDLAEWQAIDLAPKLSPVHGARRQKTQSTLSTIWHDDYSLTIERGGGKVTFTPIGLAWTNDADEVQMIATPQLGRPIVEHQDGLWVRDGLGPGIDCGVMSWPDMERWIARIHNPKRLLLDPATRPTIATRGLRLAKILSVGHDAGRLGKFRSMDDKRSTRRELVTGRPTERHRNPAPFSLRHSHGDALWFQHPRAWDAEQSFAMTAEWQRHGDSVTLICGLDVADVELSGAGLCLDTTMAEQQVASNNDDAHERGDGSFWLSSYVRVYSNPSTTSSLYRCGGLRWAACPLPAGATVSDATIAAYVYDTGFDDVDTAVYLDTSSSSPDFATLASIINPANRPRTTASTTWAATSTGTGFQAISGVGPALQERLGAGSWTSGDPLTALLIAGTGTTRTVLLHGYDTSAANAAKLNATYTEPAGGLSPAVVAAHFAMMRRRSY